MCHTPGIGFENLGRSVGFARARGRLREYTHAEATIKVQVLS